jgi:hypothetical protein
MSSEELVSRLRQAIYGRHVVRFSYAGGRVRTVEPYAVGVLATGEESLIGYQTGGYSSPSRPHGWCLYEVSKIGGLVLTDSIGSGLRPGYPSPESFERVFACVELRSGTDRRKKQVPIDFPDRRKGGDRRQDERRSGKDRRKVK